jgi:glycosyltransferase involved in cell wall biosynthesis
VRGLPGVSATTDSVRPDDGRAPDGSIRHILLVAYLYPPCNAVSAHRPAGLRRAFESAGIRTTVLTSKISGSYDDDAAQRIIRAGDLRTRFRTPYQSLVGYRGGPPLEARGMPRWWTKYIVPDPTTVSWLPQALAHLLRLIRSDPPDVILTTSGPESTHLFGLVASAFGIRWVADYRDPWVRDPRRRAVLRRLDLALERCVPRRATIVTAVNQPLATDITRRHGVRAFTISNGFDRAVLAGASNEQETVDPTRFSLVYTGTLALDANDDGVLHRGTRDVRGVQTFLEALALLVQDPDFVNRFELVVAGPISDSERRMLTRGDLRRIVRVLGLLPHTRALGLQQAADGLLLFPFGADITTGKVFEYLAAQKPIFAVTEHDGVAAELLRAAGEHSVADAADAESLAAALETYLTQWTGASYQPRSGFDLDAYEYGNLGRRLLQLVSTGPIGGDGHVSR